VPVEGIYKVDWLLPVNLPRDSCDNVLNADKYLKDLDIRLSFSKVSACYVTKLCIVSNSLLLTFFLMSYPKVASLAGTLNQFSAYIRNTNPAIFLLKSDGADHFSSSQSGLRPCQYFSHFLTSKILINSHLHCCQ
jgi:hypothetical protein